MDILESLDADHRRLLHRFAVATRRGTKREELEALCVEILEEALLQRTPPAERMERVRRNQEIAKRQGGHHDD